MFQMVALAVLTVRDRRPDPVFPRWFAYFQLWCALGVGLTFGVFIFKSGPMAWNGAVGFWIPVTFYFLWVVVTTLVTARAIKRDHSDGEKNSLAVRVRALESQIGLLHAISAEVPGTGQGSRPETRLIDNDR